MTSDAIGNTLSDGTRTYTWKHGRQLATTAMNGKTWTYTYNADGMRTKRVSGNTAYTYYYNGDMLRYLDYDSNTTDSSQAAKLYFVLDAAGNPIEVSYRPEGSTTTKFYYYVQNLQGDVIALVDSANGNTVVTYTYDAWGNVLSTNGSLATTLGVLNPFRYRGYVYDTETQLYYLQSRYYDPNLGRFLNADAFASTGQGILGYNMYAYCGNNPVIRVDDNGQYYTSGQIHDFVIDDICDKNPNKKGSREGNKIIYPEPILFSTYGYCDIHDSFTGEVWELKRFSNAPSCQFAVAYIQLTNYVNGYLAKNPAKELKYGGEYTMISPNVFTKPDRDGKGKYVIGYWDTGVGVLYYDYIYIPSGDEVAIGVATVIVAALAGWAVGAGAGALIPVLV